MSWFWIALAAPAIWAAVNHIDKYIITKYFTGKGVGSLVIFTGLSGLIISVLILLFNYSAVIFAPLSVVIIMLNGALLIAAFIPYLHALKKEEASWVCMMYQVIPVFSYFLALIFLHEYLSLQQIIGSLIIVMSALMLSIDIGQKIKFKLKPLLLMTLSSLMIAINVLVFKIIALDQNFWGTAFWEYIGGFIFVVVLFCCLPIYRRQFLATIVKSRNKVISVNLLAEFLNIIAKLLANFASLLAPLALVWVVNGFSPIIVFVYGVILTLFIPNWGKENLSGKLILQKILVLIVMLLGLYILF
jgi:drug/metabolite transporter (DMT)-like permease